MSIFEGWFGSKKEFPEEIAQETATEALAVEEVQEKPKTIADIKQAKEDLAQMQALRQEILEKHRDTTEELADIGVREIPYGDVARSETYNDVLNPIEEELTALSAEIVQKREEFDLDPSRVEVLDARLDRLKDLEDRETAAFLKTESGAKIEEYNKKIDELNVQAQELAQTTSRENPLVQEILKEIRDLEEKRRYLVINDKVCGAHQDRIMRIRHLMSDVESVRHDAKSTGYDELGHMRE